jgi:hypothetical protein
VKIALKKRKPQKIYEPKGQARVEISPAPLRASRGPATRHPRARLILIARSRARRRAELGQRASSAAKLRLPAAANRAVARFFRHFRSRAFLERLARLFSAKAVPRAAPGAARGTAGLVFGSRRGLRRGRPGIARLSRAPARAKWVKRAPAPEGLGRGDSRGGSVKAARTRARG